MVKDSNQSDYRSGIENLFDGNPAKYHKLRDVLVFFFKQRRVDDTDGPEQLADETMSRLFLRLIDGVEVENMTAYALAVARWVFLEYHKKRRMRQFIPLDEYATLEVADTLAWWRPPQQVALEESEDARFASAAWESALNKLKPSDHELLVEYFNPDLSGREKLANREKLAKDRNITLNGLRVTVHRLRSSLKRSYESELEKLRTKGRRS